MHCAFKNVPVSVQFIGHKVFLNTLIFTIQVKSVNNTRYGNHQVGGSGLVKTGTEERLGFQFLSWRFFVLHESCYLSVFK